MESTTYQIKSSFYRFVAHFTETKRSMFECNFGHRFLVETREIENLSCPICLSEQSKKLNGVLFSLECETKGDRPKKRVRINESANMIHMIPPRETKGFDPKKRIRSKKPIEPDTEKGNSSEVLFDLKLNSMDDRIKECQNIGQIQTDILSDQQKKIHENSTKITEHQDSLRLIKEKIDSIGLCVPLFRSDISKINCRQENTETKISTSLVSNQMIRSEIMSLRQENMELKKQVDKLQGLIMNQFVGVVHDLAKKVNEIGSLNKIKECSNY